MAWIEVFIVYLIDNGYIYNLKKVSNLQKDLNIQIRQTIHIQLQNITINNLPLPSEIIHIILSMLPEQESLTYHPLYLKTKRKIECKATYVSILPSIYPVTRFICNFVIFILILIYYARWYNNNLGLSQWRKYCAFIISMFYMPNCKGRGFMKLFSIIWLDFTHRFDRSGTHEDPEWWVAVYIPVLLVNLIFAIWMFFISFPVLVSGFFLFIPSSIIILCGMATFGWFGGYPLLKCTKGDFLLGSIIPMVFTFGMVWFFTVIIVSAMEFYDTVDWIDAWKIGFLGEYCDDNDYFAFYKWNEYNWEIKFIIIGWFFF